MGKKLVDFRCESGVVIGVAEIVVAQIVRHDLNDVWKLSSMHYWQQKGQEDGNHDTLPDCQITVGLGFRLAG